MQDTVEVGGNSSVMLKQFIERVENVEGEIKELGDDKKDIFKEAKGHGFDTGIMKTVIKRRKMGEGAAREADALLETYEKAINLQMPLPLQATVRTPAKGAKAVH